MKPSKPNPSSICLHWLLDEERAEPMKIDSPEFACPATAFALEVS